MRPGLSDETIRRIEQAIANGRITVQIALALGRLRIEVIGQTPDIRTR